MGWRGSPCSFFPHGTVSCRPGSNTPLSDRRPLARIPFNPISIPARVRYAATRIGRCARERVCRLSLPFECRSLRHRRLQCGGPVDPALECRSAVVHGHQRHVLAAFRIVRIGGRPPWPRRSGPEGCAAVGLLCRTRRTCLRRMVEERSGQLETRHGQATLGNVSRFIDTIPGSRTG